MSVNTSIGLIGVAKQANKSTAASTPTFVHGLTGGSTFKLDMTIEADDVSCGVRSNTDSHRESIVPGADFETYGYSDVLPLYFYGAMGDIVSTTSGTNKKHTITLGDVLPYLTVWGRTGGEYTKVAGCKVDELDMEFSGNAPLQFGVTLIGMTDTLQVGSMPGGVDPSCFDGYYIPTGGTFKIDANGTSPATAPVTAGQLTLSNNCSTTMLAGQVKPGDVAEGKLTASGSVTVKPDDMALYYEVVTGLANGTTSTGEMVYGSFEWTFTHSKESAHTLKVTANHVPFMAEWPEVDPNGGAAEVQFTFDSIGLAAAGDSPVTVEIINDTASYTS